MIDDYHMKTSVHIGDSHHSCQFSGWDTKKTYSSYESVEFCVAGCSHSLTCHQPDDFIQPVLRVFHRWNGLQRSLALKAATWSHLPDQESLHILSRQFIKWPLHIHIWLVVSIPLKNINQWEGLSHILWKIKNVWNHQPDIVYIYITNMFYMYIPIDIP